MSLLTSGVRNRKKMVILASYVRDEAYGLLGPQMAATIIQDHTLYDCIVIAVPREYAKAALKGVLAEYFGTARPLIGFSALSGREDLFALAKELKEEGTVTILAGPQADVDFFGEIGWQKYAYRFKSVAESFDFGLHGPAEQVIRLLDQLEDNDRSQIPGLLYLDGDGNLIQNPAKKWDDKYLGKVRWDNLYLAGEKGIVPLYINTGQVLQHVGCPHAAGITEKKIDYPTNIGGHLGQRIKMRLKGCSFCDVAVDKGFHGKLGMETVIQQMRCLPETPNGRKIPFELINENPLPELPALLQEANLRRIRLSQINLTLRADWLISGVRYLKEALRMAGKQGVYVLLSSIGFESFDDRILRNLNKGLNVETNLCAVRLVRRLKGDFPDQLGYASMEGANHGFIHPTAWDTKETAAEIQKNIAIYGLQNDILPPHSTPLIIHHASFLGHWIREIERRKGLRFKRYGSIIGWWDTPRRC
jgi:hypothetical protein